jgi:hypothetical protein
VSVDCVFYSTHNELTQEFLYLEVRCVGRSGNYIVIEVEERINPLTRSPLYVPEHYILECHRDGEVVSVKQQRTIGWSLDSD